MTTNRDGGQDLGRALRRSENEGISSSPVMSESRGEITGEGFGYETEATDTPESMDERVVDYDREERPVTANNLREVRIQPLDSGYLVKVGCQSVAVETTEALVKALNDYLTRPEAFERAWFKNKNRSKL